jgi:hypothetical protein
MTSLAMTAGMVPMALGLGEGGQQMAPLARAVIGGLAAATVMTLLMLPSLFAIVQARASTRSVSLDPEDPESVHYQEPESREGADGRDQHSPQAAADRRPDSPRGIQPEVTS